MLFDSCTWFHMFTKRKKIRFGLEKLLLTCFTGNRFIFGMEMFLLTCFTGNGFMFGLGTFLLDN